MIAHFEWRRILNGDAITVKNIVKKLEVATTMTYQFQDELNSHGLYLRNYSDLYPPLSRGFAVTKPHLKSAAKNIALDVISRAVGKFTRGGDNQEGAGGIMVLARRAIKRPPAQRVLQGGINCRRADKRKSVARNRVKGRKSSRQQQQQDPDRHTSFKFFLNMALLHHKSSECSMAELDLFSAPMTQLSIEEKQFTEVLPISAITHCGPIEFFIPGDEDKYLDLNDTLLHLSVKITNVDGSDLVADAPVALINYPLNL
ncbi:hypothetical protein F2P81_003946 [Scophthalmus maximus]|uniref:Uncharacterized protein n=1 Tax=Scophthalmus maximus TaxID=52904 RepID=A0A6A4TJY8_SCOMX|nr:hypothetical protein F2P81_003946 [Scophthalmus maximus]